MQLKAWILAKRSKTGFSQKNRCFLKKKTVEFFEITEVMKFPVECKWNSKTSQNVQEMGFS